MRKFIALYFKLLCVVITAVVGALLFPVTLQVVSRYTDLIPTWLWTEEAARFLLVWMVMLGATIAVRMRGHFDIDLLPEPNSPRGKLLARLLVDVVVALFGVAFLWISAIYAYDARTEVSEITEMSMALMYVAFPVSAAGWLLFLGEQIFDDLGEFVRGAR
ncbi:MAG: TRAP transporter small permease [Betaproteobacteria bacterium]|nr:TRAP transporter small permease [Betaproteobacteria bacterium]